jgi:probable DNA repair protein
VAPAWLARDFCGGGIPAPARLIFAGFDEPAPQQQLLVRALGQAGTEVQEAPLPRRRAALVRQVPCADLHAELETAARWARGAREASAEAQVAVVVPNLARRVGEVRRVFLDVLASGWRADDDAASVLNLSYGWPLAQVPLIHAALCALEAATGLMDYRTFGQLLRTPYLAGAQTEGGGRARLDLLGREQIGLRLDLKAICARGSSLAPVFCARLTGFLEQAAQWPRRQEPGRWAGALSAALAMLGWPGDRPLNSDEYQAGMAWRHLLESFARADLVVGRLSLPAALEVLRGHARERIFQPEGRPDAVQVLGAMEALGQTFDGLWICGMTSDDWPPAGRPHPLLPLALQRRLGMPDSSPAITRQRSERLLRHLVGCAPQVYLSWPQSAADEPLAPSPLIREVAWLRPEDVPRWTGRDYRSLLAAAATLTPLAEDPPPPVTDGTLVQGGVRLLAFQASCPARAFAQMRLGAEELPTPAPGIDAATRGRMAHAALAQFFTRVPDQASLRALPADDLANLINAVVASELQRQLPLARAAIRRMAQIEQQRLAELLLEFLRGECERPHFVVETREEARVERIGALSLRLRPDRVDRLAGGLRLVIDYKTGGNFAAGAWLGPRPREPQLPLYAVLRDAAAIAIVEIRAAGVRWRGVGQGGLGLPGVQDVAAFARNERFTDWTQLRSHWRRALEALAAEFMAGDFRIDLHDPELARGRWAMLTRVHELSAAATGEEIAE